MEELHRAHSEDRGLEQIRAQIHRRSHQQTACSDTELSIQAGLEQQQLTSAGSIDGEVLRRGDLRLDQVLGARHEVGERVLLVQQLARLIPNATTVREWI